MEYTSPWFELTTLVVIGTDCIVWTNCLHDGISSKFNIDINTDSVVLFYFLFYYSLTCHKNTKVQKCRKTDKPTHLKNTLCDLISLEKCKLNVKNKCGRIFNIQMRTIYRHFHRRYKILLIVWTDEQTERLS
jgi:hypothetical protein